MEINFLQTNTTKLHLHVEQLLQNTYWTLTEDLTSQKGRSSPHTWVGQKKKGKTKTKEQGWDLYLVEGAVKEENFPHTRKPLHCWRQGVVEGEASEPWRRVHQQVCKGQSGEIPTQRIGANQHSPAWEACLLTHWGRWGLRAEAWSLEVRSQE